MKQMKARLRKERIEQLGAFGKRKTQVVKDKTKYNRKDKHKGSSKGEPFALHKSVN